MKYYVIVINNDSQSIAVHDTQASALSAYHTEMAYAYAAGVDRTCLITDTYGSQIKRERYTVPTEAVEVAAEEA